MGIVSERALAFFLVFLFQNTNGFVNFFYRGKQSPFSHGISNHNNNNFNGGNNGGSRSPPGLLFSSSLNGGGDGGGGADIDPFLYTTTESSKQLWNIDNETSALLQQGAHSAMIRGGSTKKKAKKSSNDNNINNNNLVEGTKFTISDTISFWKDYIGNTVSTVKSKVSSMRQSKEEKEYDKMLQELQVMPIQSVAVPNSTVLPRDVIQLAVKRSGMIGRPLRTDRVQEFAKTIKRWYARNGYVLHDVTGATLQADTATAEIEVQEPIISKTPVGITVCKEMVIDGETGDIMTFRQYREKYAARKLGRIDRKDLNTTFIETKGRTSPSRIAKALRLQPGRPFRWDPQRWNKVASSGVFKRVLRASPERMPDGTVALQVYATEPPPRHLEYGIGKSVYTGSWEGEIDFEHFNVFGGGESVGFIFSRGTRDIEPTIKLRFADDKFGMEGGYNVELFTESLGNNVAQSDNSQTGNENGNDTDGPDNGNDNISASEDALLGRKGATLRLRNPINPRVIQSSQASLCVERTGTRTGFHESIGSATLSVGPFRKILPLDARSNIMASISTGSRFKEKGMNHNDNVDDNDEAPQSNSLKDFQILPYSSITATTQQLLPLSTATSTTTDESASFRPPMVLALHHTATVSTKNLPRHEANALGIAAQIRGASPNGRVSSSIKGTTELRVPVTIPKLQDATVVFFGDWFCVQRDHSSPFYRKSSIGVGVRKVIQGIPLKYDVSYSSEGKVKAMFGLGSDFSV